MWFVEYSLGWIIYSFNIYKGFLRKYEKSIKEMFCINGDKRSGERKVFCLSQQLMP